MRGQRSRGPQSQSRSRSRGRRSESATPQAANGFRDGGISRPRTRNREEISVRGFGDLKNIDSRRRGRRKEEYEASRGRERAERRRAGGWSDRDDVRRMEHSRSILSIPRSRAEFDLRSRSRLSCPRRIVHSRSQLNSPRRSSVDVRNGNSAISRFRDERSQVVREVRDQEIPRSEKGCADSRSTEIQRKSRGESVPRNRDAGRMPYKCSEIPQRQ